MKPATTMVSLVEDYLEYRRRLGFALKSDERRLLCFARFADQVGHRGRSATIRHVNHVDIG